MASVESLLAGLAAHFGMPRRVLPEIQAFHACCRPVARLLQPRCWRQPQCWRFWTYPYRRTAAGAYQTTSRLPGCGQVRARCAWLTVRMMCTSSPSPASSLASACQSSERTGSSELSQRVFRMSGFSNASLSVVKARRCTPAPDSLPCSNAGGSLHGLPCLWPSHLWNFPAVGRLKEGACQSSDQGVAS